MTISSTNRKAGPYAGNDVAVSFPFAFKVFAAADVLVVFTSASNVETVLTLTTNYTVSLNSNQDTNPGGTVTLPSALATGEKLTLSSAVANLQPVDLTNNGGFYPAVINKALDRATIQIQQLAEKVGRALVWPISSSGASLPVPEASKFIGWNATADSLVNLSGVAVGDAQTVSFSQAGTGAVTRTAQDKMRESASVDDYMTVQQAIDAAYVVKFIAGNTYSVGDLTVPSNRKIIVEKGATINTTGRWTSYNESNVEYQIDGVINVTSMPTAPAKTGWPNTAAGTQNGDERGFIEFGSSDPASANSSGFHLHGSGKIIGPWAGTPNFSDSVYQVNRKGIACWNAKNILVEGIDISGFDGEQVYSFMQSPDSSNIVFSNVNSHDCRFNALNFNVSAVDYAGAYRGLKIINCETKNSYTGIEASAGYISGNFCKDTTNYGIWFGLGSGRGPITVRDNVVDGCAGAGYVLSFSSLIATPIYDIKIHDNQAIGCGAESFLFNKLCCFSVRGNTSRAHASTTSANSFSFTNCEQGIVDNNITFDPGTNSTGGVKSVTSIIQFGTNPIITPAGTAVTANGNHWGFGGMYAAVTTFGNRENQFSAWSSDFITAGAGAEYVFRNGSDGNTVYASISGKGAVYDANGSTGGVVIATKKSNTSQVLPTATVFFDDLGNTHLSGQLFVSDIALIRTSTTLANGAGGSTGTLTNAPSAGAPSKWLAIMDNGTFRYIPSWEF